MQTVVGGNRSLDFTGLYPPRAPVTTGDAPQGRVVPFCRQHDMDIDRILTGNP